MSNKILVSILFLFFYAFNSTAQVKIYGTSSKEGAFCSGAIWAMQVSDSTIFDSFINYTPTANSITPIENSYNYNIIQDGNYYYFLADLISCANQSQLIRIDLNGKNKTLIKIFDTKINFLSKGDENYIYGISSNEKKLLKIDKSNGFTTNIFDFESDIQYFPSVIIKNDFVFVSDNHKVYQVKNNGTQKKLIVDTDIIRKQTNTYYHGINLENSTFDENNIYIPLTGNIPAKIITIPFNNASNYKLQQIKDYDYIEPSKTISIDGYLYFIVLKNFVGKKLLKVDNSFKTIAEIPIPTNLYAERIVAQNSKKIILKGAYDYMIYDTEKNLFIKDLSRDNYSFSYLSSKSYTNYYFKSDFSNSFNYINFDEIGIFDLTTQLPQTIFKFEESKYPVQILDSFNDKLLVLNRRNQNDYVAKIDLVKGTIIKEVKLPGRYYNNVFAIDSLQYLYTNSLNSYVFTIDSLFTKIDIPTNIMWDSLYKVKNKIFTSSYDGIYEFTENTFKKFINLNNSLRIGIFDSDDEYIYISQLQLDGKTYHFYKVMLNGQELIDLGINIALPNFRYHISPQCIKVGNYIYGTFGDVLFRVNIQTKEYSTLQSSNSFREIQYSFQDKKIYGLSSKEILDNGKSVVMYYVGSIDQKSFSFTPMKTISETKKIFIEKEKIETKYAILSVEDDNELTDSNFYPNPVNDYIKVTNIGFEDKIAIYNQIGQKLEVDILLREVNNCIIDFSKFEEGVYFIKTNHKTFKVIKQ